MSDLPTQRSEPTIRRVAGTGVPLRGDDVDTDQITPARFLKEVTFDDMGEYVFYDERHDDDGAEVAHPFNDYRGGSILVVNENFGCGSSREHAPQGLMRWGVRAIVGESFAEIFQDNCKSLGIPTATTDADTVAEIQSRIESDPDAGMELDVEKERFVFPDGDDGQRETAVSIPDAMREALVEGVWDTTAVMRANLTEAAETAADLPYTDVAAAEAASVDGEPDGDDDPTGGDDG
ncbi:MAG: 3-isopropylmalate dehydratase small subunit 2 [Halolamina sp.]